MTRHYGRASSRNRWPGPVARSRRWRRQAHAPAEAEAPPYVACRSCRAAQPRIQAHAHAVQERLARLDMDVLKRG
eukprot:365865-Chlamydomonas_euryale.AAC.1